MSAEDEASAGDAGADDPDADTDDGGGAGGPGRREVAWRLFAAEFDDADYSYSESDEERAPNYVVTPTGARINRLFVVGVLTEVEQVSEDYLRARVVDPTGAFVVYAGQYQPDALAFLERTDPPAFVAVTGKARTFQPDDSQRVYTSVRPESINAVDAETRDRWVVRTAERTLERVAAAADALDRPERGEDLTAALRESGVPDGLATGLPLAIDHYGTTETYLDALRDLALDAVRVVAGTREEVESLDVAPGEGGDVDADLTAGVDVAAATGTTDGSATGRAATDAGSPGEASTEAEQSGPTSTSESEPEPVPQPESSAGAESETPAADAESGGGSEASDAVESQAGAGGAEPSTAEPETAADESAGGETADEGTGTETETETAETDSEAAPGAETGSEEPPETDEMYEFDDEERRQVEEEHGLEFSTGAEVGGGDADSDIPEAEAHTGTSAGVESDSEAERETETETVPDEEPAAGGEPSTETGGTGTSTGSGDELGDFEPGIGDEATASEESEIETGATAETETEAEAEAGVEPESESDPEPASGSGSEPAEDVDLEDAVVEAMQEIGDGGGADREAVVERVVERYGVDPEAAEEAIQDALMSGRCYESGDGEITPI